VAIEESTIKGSVVISDGSSAEGVEVVFKDIATGQEYTAPVNAAGEYSLAVPSNARYQLVRALGPDGLVIDIQNNLPLVVRTPGVYTQAPLSIKVVDAPTPPSLPVTEPQVKMPEPPKPWYKRKGPIIGIVLGGIGVGLALSGGDDANNPVSP
jgi:hypothetical protein